MATSRIEVPLQDAACVEEQMRILGERGLNKDQKSGKELREEHVPIHEPRGQLRVLQPEQVL